MLNEKLEEMKFDLVDDGISVQYVPTNDDLRHCFLLGEKIKAEILK